MKDIELGDKVKDIITGLEGIAVARIEYLNGCIQFGVKAQAVEAATKEAEYIDETQLRRLGNGINKPETARPGGVMPEAPKKSYGK